MDSITTRWAGSLGRALRLLPLALLGLTGTALAQADSQMCRIECAAPFAERAQNTISIQACLARCAARSAALGKANVTGLTPMPNPQSPWTSGPVAQRPQRQAEAPRPAARTAQRGTPRGRKPAPNPVATPEPTAVAAARPAAPPAAPQPPAPASFLGSLIAAQAAVPGASAAAPAAAAGTARPAEGGRGSFGAVYFATAPSRGYGLAVGVGDRGAAHRAAESACHGGVGNACRLAGDFTARCAAVVHGLRPNGAVVMTAHPSTYTVIAATSGTGATREEAERQAIAACGQRGRGLTCQVTEARCGG